MFLIIVVFFSCVGRLCQKNVHSISFLLLKFYHFDACLDYNRTCFYLKINLNLILQAFSETQSQEQFTNPSKTCQVRMLSCWPQQQKAFSDSTLKLTGLRLLSRLLLLNKGTNSIKSLPMHVSLACISIRK